MTKKTKLPQPMGDRVLAIRDIPEQKTAGGIIIPEMSQELANRATVLAVGPKFGKDSGQLLKPGDVIEFGEHAFVELPHEGVDYILVKENDIRFIKH